jgi:hypothetical protein
MRLMTLAMVFMLGLTAVAAAQPAARVPATGSFPPLPHIGLPLPQIGLPLPQIGLPLPPTGIPRVASPRHNLNHPLPLTRRQHHPAVAYVVPAYGWPAYDAPIAIGTTASQNASATAFQPQRSVGQLELDLDPTGAQQQLYVDGNYLGTFKDFSGGLELDAGLHIVEIQAPGYEMLHLEVNISASRSIAYRGALTPSAPMAAPEVSGTPVTPPIIYIIPGCYIGNVPPQDVELPTGCDVNRVVTSQR